MLLLIAALAVTFLLCCVIYYSVPKGHVPWHGVWPGALFVTVTTGIANAVYPFYLAQVSSVGEVGGTIGFVLIAMVWFYLVSLGADGGRGDQRAPLRAPRHGRAEVDPPTLADASVR